MPSNELLCCCKSDRLGKESSVVAEPFCGLISPIIINWSESLKLSGLRSTLSTTEKIAVVAPMPSAIRNTATSVKPGRLSSTLTAYLTSCKSVCIAGPPLIDNHQSRSYDGFAQKVTGCGLPPDVRRVSATPSALAVQGSAPRAASGLRAKPEP